MKWKKQTCKSIDHRCDVKSTYVTVPTSSGTFSDCLSLQLCSFLPSAMVSVYLQTTASPEEEPLHICPSASHYVPNVPMFCLSLRNSVYKLPIVMHSKAFIHAQSCILCVHAFDKIVILSICIYILNPMLISIKINRVNFKNSSANNKCLLSCQFQNSTVLSTFLSNSSSCSYVN